MTSTEFSTSRGNPSPAAPTPGFRLDADFLARQFGDVNRDQARLEGIEWRGIMAFGHSWDVHVRHGMPLIERH